MRYLLDTNACIEVLRSKGNPAVRLAILSQPPGSVHTCTVVRAELLFGARRTRDVQAAVRRTLEFLSLFGSFPFDDASADRAAEVRAELAAGGLPIGPMDLLIAATALAHDATLITHNTTEFGRVAGLKISDWQTPTR